MSLRWRSLLAICALGSYLPSATAHPHSWIDMVSRLEMAPPHQLKALHLAWLFDEFYSATILDEAKEKKHTVDQELAEFAKQGARLAQWRNEPLAAQLARWEAANVLTRAEAKGSWWMGWSQHWSRTG